MHHFFPQAIHSFRHICPVYIAYYTIYGYKSARSFCVLVSHSFFFFLELSVCARLCFFILSRSLYRILMFDLCVLCCAVLCFYFSVLFVFLHCVFLWCCGVECISVGLFSCEQHFHVLDCVVVVFWSTHTHSFTHSEYTNIYLYIYIAKWCCLIRRNPCFSLKCVA